MTLVTSAETLGASGALTGRPTSGRGGEPTSKIVTKISEPMMNRCDHGLV